MRPPPDQPPPGPLSAARTAAIAASLLALLAVVSVAARSGDHDRAVPGGVVAGSAGHHAVVWMLLVIGPIAAVLGLAVFLYSQVMRRRDNPQMAALRKRRQLQRRILAAAVIALIVYSVATDQNPAEVLVNLLKGLFGNFDPARLHLFGDPQAPRAPHGHARPAAGGVSALDWALAGLTWLLIVAAAVVAFRRIRRPREPQTVAPAPSDDEPADTRLAQLRAEPDPRRAVIGAYALMDRLMADRALGRRRSEAPLEYLGRMTAAGFGRITALGRLTRLYARARFSTHPVDAAMQAEAVDAAESIATQEAAE